jgi:hypothetical protein
VPSLVEPRQGYSSLEQSLWADYALARHMGLSDLGTYNPSSTLPGGGKSDHAYYPARAFDAGFSPPIGYAHPIARAFFEAMVGRPEVGYVILGNVIWSRERGRHAYTAGGHAGHVHVSGAQGAPVTTDPYGGGRTLSPQELADLWISYGGAPRQATMAAAVARRESGGNPRAHALTSREDSRGLWQINVRAHPTWALRDLYDPRVNVQAAVAISSNGSNWNPWTTAAAARADVAANRVPVVVRPGGSSGGGGILGGVTGAIGGAAGAVGGALGNIPGVGDVLGLAQSIAQLVAFVVDPTNWLRLFEVVAGFLLILSGIGMLVVQFGSKSPVAQTAATVIPAGRAAKAAGLLSAAGGAK